MAFANLGDEKKKLVGHKHKVEPVSIYGNGSPLSSTGWAANHWKDEHKAHIMNTGVVDSNDFFQWYPYSQDYYKFFQCYCGRGEDNIRNGNGCIGEYCELLAKCKDASIASSCMNVVFRVRRDTRRFNPTEFLLSKAISKTWVYLDGNTNQTLNIPFDDPSVVANAWGIMTKAYYEEKVSLGVFEGRQSQAVPPPAAAAAASVSIGIIRFVSLSTTLHYSIFLTLHQANGNGSDDDSDDEISLEPDDDSDLSLVEEQIVAAVSFESLLNSPTEVSRPGVICHCNIKLISSHSLSISYLRRTLNQRPNLPKMII